MLLHACMLCYAQNVLWYLTDVDFVTTARDIMLDHACVIINNPTAQKTKVNYLRVALQEETSPFGAALSKPRRQPSGNAVETSVETSREPSGTRRVLRGGPKGPKLCLTGVQV